MSRRELLEQRRFTVVEPDVLISSVRGRGHVPSRDPDGGCAVGCQVLTVGLSAQRANSRRLQ